MIDPADSLDFQLCHARSHMVGGGDSVWGQSPSEILQDLEEIDHDDLLLKDRAALREEIFNGLLEYVFSGGLEPWNVSMNVRVFLLAAHDFPGPRPLNEEMHKLVHAASDEGDFWVDADAVSAELKRREYSSRYRRQNDSAKNRSLCVWFSQLREEIDVETVESALRSLSGLLACEGYRPRSLVAVVYCLAKALKPELILSMSLHSIAIMCGDSGRATPQARCERIYTLLLERNGARGARYAHQKTATASEISRKAQMGNQNRTKNFHPKKKRK